MLGKVAALWFACVVSLCAEAESLTPSYVVEWKGSAFKDGDAFLVTAEIGEKAVEVKWDGFAGPRFDFMDEGKKERSRKTLRFNDPGTVGAFHAIARNSEWADVGGPSAMGQGVCVEAEVRGAGGKQLRSMYYFATRPEFVIANRFEQIPWDVKRMVGAEDESVARTRFTTSLESFADDLRECGDSLRAIEEAYKMKEGFPHEVLSRVAVLPTYQEFRESYGSDHSPAVEKVDELLKIVSAALGDCLDPARRMALFGKDSAGGGCLVRVDVVSMGYGDEVAMARLPKDGGSPHYRVISGRVEELLLRFISGGRTLGRFPMPMSCKLRMKNGVIVVEEGALWFRDDGALLDQEMKLRLEWLNEQKVFQGMASELKGGAEGMLGLIPFAAIRVHPEDPERIKFDYTFRGEDYVVEARNEDGEWTPGKRWAKREYYLHDGVFHNGTHFRADEP